jgi:hypothetical protein
MAMRRGGRNFMGVVPLRQIGRERECGTAGRETPENGGGMCAFLQPAFHE